MRQWLRNVGKKVADTVAPDIYKHTTEFSQGPEVFRSRLASDVDKLINLIDSHKTNLERTPRKIRGLAENVHRRFDAITGFTINDPQLGNKFMEMHRKLGEWEDEQRKKISPASQE